MTYTNSPLVTYKKISPNKTSPRNHAIDTLTIHCFVGQVTAQKGCEAFQNKSKKASCNYVVGYDGSVGLCVEEKDRSWCSSNRANDMRAITFEVASDTKHPYKVTDAALNALIELIVDICKRNGKKKILWFADENKTLAYSPKADEMVMTVHRWFAAKACPGDYLYNLHNQIAAEVNRRIGNANQTDISLQNNPFEEPITNVKKGTRGESAKWVQWYLWRFGLLQKDEIDGIVGQKSDAAIREAQQRLGLTADGIVGKATRTLWKKIC